MTFWQSVTQWDVTVLDYIQEHLRTAFGDTFFSFITHFSDGGLFWIALSLILMIIPKTRRSGFCMAISIILGGIVGNLLIKPLVGRIRPFDLIPGMRAKLLVTPPTDASFPSGHTYLSVGVATALCRTNAKAGIPALILAALIMLSRLYLYIHYPTDVIAGLLMGILFGCIAPPIWDKWGEKAFVACRNFVFRKHKIEHV